MYIGARGDLRMKYGPGKKHVRKPCRNYNATYSSLRGRRLKVNAFNARDCDAAVRGFRRERTDPDGITHATEESLRVDRRRSRKPYYGARRTRLPICSDAAVEFVRRSNRRPFRKNRK